MASPGPIGVEALLAHREWARGLARALVRDPADADDLEQTAWLEAIRRPPARDEGLRGWFATLLRRRARDRWREGERRGRREAATARSDAVRPTAEVVADAEAHRLVVEALMALEEPFRETLLLRFFEDLPPREVATRIGVPVETVRSRTRRGLERLRERLDGGRPGGRAAWVALIAPLAGIRGEAVAAAAAGGSAAGAGSVAAAGGAAMATKATAGVAVLGALAGAVAGGVAVGTMSGGSPEAAVAEARAEVRELRGRLEAIEGSGAAAGAPSAAAAGEGPAGREERFEAQERRIAALEEAVRTGSGAASGPRDAGATDAAGRESRDAADRAVLDARKAAEEADKAKAEAAAALGSAEARKLFLDRSKTDEERVVALGRLRTLRGVDREVIAEACALFRASTKPGIREWLLRDLHGTKDPDLKALFVEAMRSDPDEKVRERAARDVDDYLDDPEVRQALERARDQDASESVRRRAVRTLASSGGKDD